LKINYWLRHKITPQDKVNKAKEENDLLQDGLHQMICHHHHQDGNKAILFLHLQQIGYPRSRMITRDLVKKAKKETGFRKARTAEEKKGVKMEEREAKAAEKVKDHHLEEKEEKKEKVAKVAKKKNR
jgi:hypothetical protein